MSYNSLMLFSFSKNSFFSVLKRNVYEEYNHTVRFLIYGSCLINLRWYGELVTLAVGLGWEAKNVNISNVPKWCRFQAVCWESLASEYMHCHCNNQLWSLLCTKRSQGMSLHPCSPLKEWGRTADTRERAHSACWVHTPSERCAGICFFISAPDNPVC